MTYNISSQVAQLLHPHHVSHMLTNALYPGCKSVPTPNIHINKPCLTGHTVDKCHFTDHILTHLPYHFNSCHNNHHHGLLHNGLFHNDYDLCHGSHGAGWFHHHDGGNTLVLNMLTPSNPGAGVEKPAEPAKSPLDLKDLVLTIGTDNVIINSATHQKTGLTMVECGRILKADKGNLTIENNQIVGQCSEGNSKCTECVKAINSSVQEPASKDVSEEASYYNVHNDII